jgi:hypothetical protein
MPTRESGGKSPARARSKNPSRKGSEMAAGTTALPSPPAGAGTLSEKNESLKTGAPALEPQSLDGSLMSQRVNSKGQALTTNQGVPVASNQDSLKAGLRSPRYSGISSSATKSRVSIMNASLSASCTPVAPVRMVTLKLRVTHRINPRCALYGGRQAHPGLRPFLNRGGRARFGRYRPRCARHCGSFNS